MHYSHKPKKSHIQQFWKIMWEANFPNFRRQFPDQEIYSRRQMEMIYQNPQGLMTADGRVLTPVQRIANWVVTHALMLLRSLNSADYYQQKRIVTDEITDQQIDEWKAAWEQIEPVLVQEGFLPSVGTLAEISELMSQRQDPEMN